MLVLSVTLPTSSGCLSFADVNSMAKAFLPWPHFPDSPLSVTTTSFADWVAMTFSALHAGATATTTLLTTTALIHGLMCMPWFLLSWVSFDRAIGRLGQTGLGAPEISLAKPVEENGCHDQDQQ